MRSSRTAEYMALFRALETLAPPERRCVDDPFARRFLRPALRAVLLAARRPGARRLALRFLDSRWPGARSSGVARTRWLDDALRAELAAGCRQVVILGAGFDARAWRLPELAGARVFELDRAATQARKRARLGAGAAPVFVAADLGSAQLGPALRAAGFDPAQRACFLLEGVTNYLGEEAVAAVLRCVGLGCAPGSALLFTYVHRGLLAGSFAAEGAERLRRTLARSGEPWTFGLDPAELSGYLAERGLVLEEDLGASEYRARVLGEAGRGYEFYRAARARVVERAACRA
jgi:methyltransferase (TIGR00027 family)